MRLEGRYAWLLRISGAAWIVIAPVLWVMAGISRIESDFAYNAQLLVVSVIAAVAVVCGIGGLLRYAWAARGLLLMSGVCCIALLGAAAYMLVYSLLAWSKSGQWTDSLIGLTLAASGATSGLPFLFLGLTLRRALRGDQAV